MIVRYRVTERLPLPARTAVNVVQAALKVNRNTASTLIHDGLVSSGGRVVSQTHFQIPVGMEVEIDYAPQPAKTTQKKSKAKKKAQGQRTQFEIVHDDDHLVVVNKPAGLLTVPSPKKEKVTLLSQLQKWQDAIARNTRSSAPNLICVHRLDRGVSGLLVFSKDELTADLLRGQFASRKPERKYVAIVRGEMQSASGTIQTYLATDEKSLSRYSVEDPLGGELAITHYRVKEHWQGASLVTVTLETGRRNQIRVHLAEAGHPVIGDNRYRPKDAEHAHWPHKRLALHAETLGFEHPDSGEELLFSAPWPDEFRAIRRRLRRTAKQR